MARGLDSDYIGSISLMDGFDMGITFDGFGENMKKFMELPIKYLDSAHDKAVELVEDIHALIYAHSPDDKFPDKDHGTLTDPSSNDHSLGSTATDVHETESVSSTSPAMCASEDPISLERTADTKEEVTFCNSEDLSDNCTPENHNSLGGSDSSDEEIILWNQWNSVTSRQYPEQATVVQDYISEEANGNKIIEQVELHGSGHSVAFDGAILLGKVNGEEQSELCSANSHEESTKHDLRVGQELMKYNKADASSVPQPKNTSFKKVLMRSLSNKLRWSKKDMNVHQAVPFRPQKSVDICYEVVCSSDGLEDDWELL
ncbi:hypothetical protein CFC21_034682 [Triticum aestivum]|uniref:Uncharacterized protein n=3 Tax=Triticum TaxID=4564 RepID=A0A9R0REF9_TRITD|nr:hypothetical protein CFC21_034682 [Triticum aestivum]VAH58963.1 unnamed protein product [Triticum turgidum subsp. durum]